MLTINKIKLINKGEALEYSYDKLEADGRRNIIKGETGKYPCHDDLITAFGALAPHVAFLAGYRDFPKNWEKVKIEDYTEKFICTSFSLGGESNEGVVVTGHHLRWDGKAVGFNCPFELLEEGDAPPESGKAKRYPFLEELNEALDHLDTEARHYMDGTKKGQPKEKAKEQKAGDPNQLTIDGEIAKVTKAVIAEPAKPGELGTFKSEPSSYTGIPAADPEAMQRVREGFAEDAEVISETLNKPASSPADVAADIVNETNAAQKKNGRGRPRRVAQSPDVPGGIVNDDNDLDANK